jgi:hypothetical protein
MISKASNTVSGIKQKSQNQGHRTLVFHITGDVTTKAHKAVILDKGKLFSEVVAQSHMTKSESGFTCNAYYMAILSYGTTATGLSLAECETIQNPLVNSILPKMGIRCTASRAVTFGTGKYGRLCLNHVYTVQGHNCIQYLMGHLRCQDVTRKLSNLLLDFINLECDIQEPVSRLDFTTYKDTILTNNWITDNWEHLSECDGKITVEDIWNPSPGQNGDNTIMEMILKSYSGKLKYLPAINQCRIYLQAFYMSDIANETGNQLAKWAREGKRSNAWKSSLQCSVQQRPPKLAWCLWRAAVLKESCENEYLTNPLGSWINNDGHQICAWSMDSNQGLFSPHSRPMDTPPTYGQYTLNV